MIRASDVAAPMVASARRRVDRLQMENVTVETRDAGDIAAGTEPADLVVGLNAMLGYLVPAESRQRALAGLTRLLRPNGVLAGVVQQRLGRPDWALWFAAHDLLARSHLIRSEPGDRWIGDDAATVAHHHFTRAELRSDLTDAGLSAIQVVSLRQQLRPNGLKPPVRSPNPLLYLGSKGT